MYQTHRIAKAQSRTDDARHERKYLVRGGKAAQDARRHAARLDRHIIREALRAHDYETLEVL